VIVVRELPPVCSGQRQHLPSIRDLVSPTPGPQERAILAYLAQGVDCGIYNDPGMLYDVIQPGKKIEFSSVQEVGPDVSALAPHLIMTDGVWVWPGAVLYYIATYHIRLPDALLRHAERCQWTIDPSQFSPEELSWDAFDAVGVAGAEVRWIRGT
jgi:hypothetical protein